MQNEKKFSEKRIKSIKHFCLSHKLWKWDRYEKDLMLYAVLCKEEWSMEMSGPLGLHICICGISLMRCFARLNNLCFCTFAFAAMQICRFVES